MTEKGKTFVSTGKESSPILLSNGSPPNLYVHSRLSTFGLNGPALLLAAAWSHGMTLDDEVHRYALFAYIQTHLSPKSQEQLQRVIETRSDPGREHAGTAEWSRQGNGIYKLTDYGARLIRKRFGDLPPKESLTAKYLLTKSCKEFKFTVTIDPVNPNLIISVNNRRIKGGDACEILRKLGQSFHTNSTGSTARVWNWIVRDGMFTWQRSLP